MEFSPSSPPNVYQPYHLPPSPQDPLLPAGLPTHLAPSSCASDPASADHCACLQIIFTYLLTLYSVVNETADRNRILEWCEFQFYYRLSKFTKLYQILHVRKGKERKRIAVCATSTAPLRELTCHIGSHSVTCHPAEVTFPPLPQPIKAGTRFSDPRGVQG